MSGLALGGMRAMSGIWSTGSGRESRAQRQTPPVEQFAFSPLTQTLRLIKVTDLINCAVNDSKVKTKGNVMQQQYVAF
jgi:hypothetical protein